MCLVFLAFSQAPAPELLVLFNRDEDYDRPTAPLARWDDAPDVFGGRDLLRGGTWAGVRADGVFACVTFVRERYASSERKPSRGLLVSDFLRSRVEPEVYLKELAEQREAYWGYNILLGTRDAVYHYSNRGTGITRLTSGIHGVSNATLNTPWPKVVRGKERLARLMQQGGVSDEEALTLMSEAERAPDHRLPQTGVSLERERQLSSLFVRTPAYGTLTTSLIRLHVDTQIEFTEWTHEHPENGSLLKRTEWFSDEKV